MTAIKLSPTIEAAGYGLAGTIGGLPRTTYYTPDGRVIRAIPDTRQFVRKARDGNVIASGVRDANLDRGWLLEMPKVKQLFCRTCDRWHQSQKEVLACLKRQTALIKQVERTVKREQVDRASQLETEVAELKAMVAKLLEERHGTVFQPGVNEQKQVPAQPGRIEEKV